MAITVVVLQKTSLVLQYSQLLYSHYCGNTVKFVPNPTVTAVILALPLYVTL